MLDDDLHEETLPNSVDGSLRPYRFDWSPKIEFPLYKATTRQRFDDLLETDEIYLNTLYNLADEAKYKRGLGDRNEGSRGLVYTGGDCVQNSSYLGGKRRQHLGILLRK